MREIPVTLAQFNAAGQPVVGDRFVVTDETGPFVTIADARHGYARVATVDPEHVETILDALVAADLALREEIVALRARWESLTRRAGNLPEGPQADFLYDLRTEVDAQLAVACEAAGVCQWDGTSRYCWDLPVDGGDYCRQHTHA